MRIDGDDIDIDDETIDSVTSLLAADCREWPAILRARPKLLSVPAEYTLNRALSEIPPGATAEMVAKVHDAFSLVKRGRDLGTAAALAELDIKLRNPQLADILRRLDFADEDGSDTGSRVVLYELALGLLAAGDDAILRARLQLNLAAYLQKIDPGGTGENLERAIDVLQDAEEVFTRQRFPERWAGIQANLAGAFVLRLKGSPVKNLEKADQYFAWALEVFTPAAHPAHHANLSQSRALAREMQEEVRGDSE